MLGKKDASVPRPWHWAILLLEIILAKEARFFSREELKEIEIAITHKDIVDECFMQQ